VGAAGRADRVSRLNQRSRRNLTESEILRYVKAVHKPKPKGGDRGNQHTGGKVAIPTDVGIDKSKNPGAESTAATLGVNRGKVEKALLVASDPEATKAVEAGPVATIATIAIVS
jgi:hypothetical protein